MMKFLHTADWHLGDTFHGYDRIEEHRHFLRWLEQRIEEQQPDALLVAGDIFDNANPSAVAEELLYTFLSNVVRNNEGLLIVLTAGNHDSGRRLEAPASLLKNMNVVVRGVVEHDDKGRPVMESLIVPVHSRTDADRMMGVMAVPYLRTGDVPFHNSRSQSVREFFHELSKVARKMLGRDVPLVLMAHLYAAGSEIAQDEHSERLVIGGEDCIDVGDIYRDAGYVALGHIHKAQRVGAGKDQSFDSGGGRANVNVFYSGSALGMSFSERNYHHGINSVVIDDEGRVDVERIEYKPQRRLMTLPETGAAPLPEIIRQIEALPKADATDPLEWPYIEIRLEETTPSQTAQNEILSALDNRSARLCRLVREMPQGSEDGPRRKMQSLDQLRNISPLDIAMDAYLQATGKEMSEQLAALFQEAANEAGLQADADN